MVCIYCSASTEVSNSRHKKIPNQVWRRRKCTECQAVFSTNESPCLDSALRVRTKNQKLQPFNRDRLFASVLHCCQHRSSSVTDASALTETIINKLLSKHKNAVIERADIVSTAQAVLSRFDKASVVQYCAFHPLA